MLDVEPAYQDIKQQVQTALGSAVKIYDSNVPLNVQKESTSGMFSPYVVMTIGGGIRSLRSRHIADSRMDTVTYWVVFTAVAPRDDEARRFKSIIMNALFGFVPRDSSQLVPSGGTAQGVANENKIPIIFQQRIMFEFSHNMETW